MPRPTPKPKMSPLLRSAGLVSSFAVAASIAASAAARVA